MTAPQLITPQEMDRYLRSNTAQTGQPTFFGSNILRLAKSAGLDVDRLKADGVIVETQRIPAK